MSASASSSALHVGFTLTVVTAATPSLEQLQEEACAQQRALVHTLRQLDLMHLLATDGRDFFPNELLTGMDINFVDAATGARMHHRLLETLLLKRKYDFSSDQTAENIIAKLLEYRPTGELLPDLPRTVDELLLHFIAQTVARWNWSLQPLLVQLVVKLHSRGFDLDRPCLPDGRTLLTASAMLLRFGNVGLVQELLQLGASPWVADRLGDSLLTLWLSGNDSRAVHDVLLRQNGWKELMQRLDWWAPDSSGRTPAQLVAAMSESDNTRLMPLVSALLEHWKQHSRPLLRRFLRELTPLIDDVALLVLSYGRRTGARVSGEVLSHSRSQHSRCLHFVSSPAHHAG